MRVPKELPEAREAQAGSVDPKFREVPQVNTEREYIADDLSRRVRSERPTLVLDPGGKQRTASAVERLPP
ncbi:MAG: hypothetical protein WKF41_18810 [Gaiellaceae bacterium]